LGISYLFRKGTPFIIYIHGLGLNKETANIFFNSPKLSEFGILAIDLPGHGDSLKLENKDDYNFEFLSIEINNIIKNLEIQEYNLILHSISSPLILSPYLSSLNTIILIEGNLTSDDTSWSMLITEMNYENLIRHNKLLKLNAKKLIQFQLHNIISEEELILYSNGLLKVDAYALSGYSKNAIKIIKSKNFIKKLDYLKDKILYLKGENSGKWDNTKKLLNDIGIKKIVITNSKHLTHIDNPSMVVNTITNFINNKLIK
jgi:hypothetical protein